MKARVTVTLKNGVLDPQGKAIEARCGSLGVDGRRRASARARSSTSSIDPDRRRRRPRRMPKAMCEKLLANTVDRELPRRDRSEARDESRRRRLSRHRTASAT
jgi:phosphoribosylformylglycinamidine synthase